MRVARSFAFRLCAALAAPCAAHAETVLQLEPAFNFDSNLSRAHDSDDVKADGSFSLAASASEVFALSGADLISLGLNLKESQYLRFHGLNAFEAGPALAYRRKFGLGAQAPWVSLSAAWTYQDFASSIRDGNTWQLQLAAGRRWGHRLDGSAGLGYDRRDARGGERAVPTIAGNAFDLHGASVFARLNYALCERARAGVRLNLRRGLVESSTRPGRGIYSVSDAITEDPVFGDEFYAYRIKGTTITAGTSLGWTLGAHSSLNLTASYDHTRAGAFQYDGGGGGLSYVFRY
ncbi:MAG: hypothetical protein ISP90_16815 [Nevskia sp.]|nr:hypothetical protein [Nevskia sp.]